MSVMNHMANMKSVGERRRPAGRVWHPAERFFRARFAGIAHAFAPCLTVMVAVGIALILASGVMAADNNTHTFKADKRYLVLPCARGVHGQNKVSIDVDGKPYLAVANTLITASEPDHCRWRGELRRPGPRLSENRGEIPHGDPQRGRRREDHPPRDLSAQVHSQKVIR